METFEQVQWVVNTCWSVWHVPGIMSGDQPSVEKVRGLLSTQRPVGAICHCYAL
jgi:hypothetical protein